MLTQQTIALLVLRGEAYFRELVQDLTSKERNGDVQDEAWDKPIIMWQHIDNLNFALRTTDYDSADTIAVYDQLSKCIGANALGPLSTDPRAQLPAGNIVIIQVSGGTGGGSTVQSIILPFEDTFFSIPDFQTVYKPTFGNGAVISLWTIKEGGIGYQEDTGNTPSKTFTDNDPTKDLLTLDWEFGAVTKGYVQILGFKP